MSDFENAEKLFRLYERSGSFDKLEESLEILDSLIEENGPDSQRAIMLNARVRSVLESQFVKMADKYNVRDFAKSIQTKSVEATFSEILSIMSPEDKEYLLRLFRIIADRA